MLIMIWRDYSFWVMALECCIEYISDNIYRIWLTNAQNDHDTILDYGWGIT